VRAVLFDLDGTLLDTVADITLALNGALADARLAGLGEEEVRTMIGRGVPMLIERAVTRLGAHSSDSELLLERFHSHYERIHTHEQIRTRAYPGVAEGLAVLRGMGLRLAVVTNKPEAASTALLTRLSLKQWIGVVIGGNGVRHRKPHPEPLLAACSRLAVAPADALMVGDSLTDVQAARAAGLRVVCVPYGYNEGADPRTLPCDAFVESIADLPALVRAI
jgi:phosphoglycolate phosphatase